MLDLKQRSSYEKSIAMHFLRFLALRPLRMRNTIREIPLIPPPIKREF